ncbi:ABC transporter substrate-binding protein [Aquabacter spiritensis]|uniref:Amino acid/amide ABC transporter substrate-binding protein (HAAT family) n=1 Tax=Aquabacter spiritensis TaxID=933073 RepID=A0A4R3LLF5_9HYPH|nr:ABC transporter substrate-binding protein [Aquabacter spiritensis]TCT01074.1 amino acid/amide ABC transporter substrate-binding protein (HAAT family) [Aquabacter spiritensis]
MDRRTFLKTGVALAAVGAVAKPYIARAQASGPIKIGMMAPLTGVVAAGGREMVDGFNMYWDEHGGEMAGRKVEIIVEDDGANPDMALQKARRLVEQAGVSMLFGNLLANTGLAVANYVKGNGMPYFIPIIAADDLTQRNRIKNVVRVAGYTGSQFPRPLADWCLKQGYKKAATISQDYTFGQEQCGGFCQTFTEGGGQIVSQFWHPLNTSDFSPYLGQLANLGVDVIFAMETGADATRFMQQYSNFGLKGQIPLVGAMNMTDQSVIRTMGSEAEGIIVAAHFAEGSPDPVTQKFVAAHVKKFNKLPSLYGFSMYSGAMWVDEAAKTIKGNVEDRDTLLSAVSKTELTGSPLGQTVKLDAFGNPIYDVHIRKVVKNADGKLWNAPIATYPQVSQFWKYNPETYMKQPPYSRDFQGIKKS